MPHDLLVNFTRLAFLGWKKYALGRLSVAAMNVYPSKDNGGSFRVRSARPLYLPQKYGVHWVW